MKLWFKFLPLLLAAVVLAGCAGTGVSALKSITVSVVEIKPGPDGQTALMTVRYFNASTIPIGLSEADHRLQVNGIDLGRGLSSQPVGLPPSGSATETVTLELARGAVLPTGQAAYLLDTRILVMAGMEKLRERTEARGMIEISQP